MKKKFAVIAVAAVMAPPAALAAGGTPDVTFYGRIHASVDSVTGNGPTAGSSARNRIGVNDNSSRFGLKTSHDIGNGLTGFLQVEAALDGNGSANGSALPGLRDTFIGLGGGFGKVLVGKLPAANQYVYDSNYFADQLGDAANLTADLMPGRANRALHYIAPKVADMTAAVTYLPASSLENTVGGYAAATDQAKSSYGVTAAYDAHGITAKVAYFSVGLGSQAALGFANANLRPISVSASYNFGIGTVSAQHVTVRLVNAGVSTTRRIYNVGGKINVGSNGAVKAQYSRAGERGVGTGDGASMLAVGYDHSLSKQMGVYVVYAQTTNDKAGKFLMDGYGHNSQSAGMAAGNDPRGVGVGLTYNF